MAKRFRLRELEQELGDLHQIIPALVNEKGQGGAADQLGISQATISQWLSANGYIKREKWVRGATTYKPIPEQA